MHPSVLEFVSKSLTREEVSGKRVVEVGSLDVNGSPRQVIMRLGPREYLGVDCCLGKNVDVVCNAELLTTVFGEESCDVVVTTEMLEHVVEWKVVVNQLKRIVKRNGILLVTTRSPGFPYHPYPIDMWRYTREDFKKIFSDFNISVLDNDYMAPGVFMKAVKPAQYLQIDLADKVVRTV